MNSITKLGLAAVLVIGGATAVIAQDAAAPSTDTTTTGSVGAGASFETLMTTLDSTAAVDLAAVTDATTINFATVSTLEGADPAALDTKLTEKADAMTALHASIEGNAALKSKIEAGGYTVDKIIAVEPGADGSFTFYVDDRA